MLIRFPRDLGGIYIGRGVWQRHDACIDIFWGWRKDALEGELRWRRLVTLSWDWLPIRRYRCAEPAWGWHEYSSAAWTGRDEIFLGFGRWPRTFMVTRCT